MKKVLKGVLIGMLLLGAGFGSAWLARSLAGTQVPQGTETSSGKKATVVVSGNLKKGGDCHDHYTDGCELFKAIVDLDSGEVSDVQDLVTDAGSVSFPRLSTDGGVLTYISTQNGKDSAMILDMGSGQSETLSQGATHPFPSADGRTAYLTLSNGFQLATVDLSTPMVTVEDVPGVKSAHEPQVSAQGLVAFYSLTQGEDRGSGTAQAMVYVPSTGKTVEVSASDGSAHCYWNFDGSELYCNNRRGGGVLAYPVSADGTVGASTVAIPFPSAQELQTVDPEFTAACSTVSVEYGSFCDADHVVLTAGCYSASGGTLDQSFTQTVLYDIQSKSYLPLGYNLAKVYGASQGTTWTGTCAME